jgi:hypothetical protein
MALVRGASQSKTTGMHRGIPLLGIMPAKRLKNIALRITSMPIPSLRLLFQGRTGSRSQSASTSRGFEGLLVIQKSGVETKRRGAQERPAPQKRKLLEKEKNYVTLFRTYC